MEQVKSPRKNCTFKLTKITRDQLKLMATYDKENDADLIQYALEKLWMNSYPDLAEKFPELRNYPNYILTEPRKV